MIDCNVSVFLFPTSLCVISFVFSRCLQSPAVFYRTFVGKVSFAVNELLHDVQQTCRQFCESRFNNINTEFQSMMTEHRVSFCDFRSKVRIISNDFVSRRWRIRSTANQNLC